MTKHRSATDQWNTLEAIGKVWQEHPDKSLASLIFMVSSNVTDLYLLEDATLVKRLEKLNENR